MGANTLVKKSKIGVCITSDRCIYKKIKPPKTYNTLDECLQSAGRMLKK